MVMTWCRIAGEAGRSQPRILLEEISALLVPGSSILEKPWSKKSEERGILLAFDLTLEWWLRSRDPRTILGGPALDARVASINHDKTVIIHCSSSILSVVHHYQLISPWLLANYHHRRRRRCCCCHSCIDIYGTYC